MLLKLSLALLVLLAECFPATALSRQDPEVDSKWKILFKWLGGRA